MHSETGQPPLARWSDGWRPVPAARAPAALTEAFLWEEHRTVTKTATVSLHGNTYQVDPLLVGRRVELVFDPFDLDHHRGPLPRRPRPAPRSRTGSGATPTSRPDPRQPTRAAGPDRDRLRSA